MDFLRNVDKTLFPIKNISSVVKLFRNQLEGCDEPDLTLLSIAAGFIENQLTSRSVSQISAQSNDATEKNVLPIFELETVESLYNKFNLIITSAIEPNKTKSYATRELVKKVSDIIWNSLTRSYYSDKAHLQSLYSYLTGNKLDCFGVAFAVVAGCQTLGYGDVHLALSEDHAWVVFGPDLLETIEVTWHGKGNEDKRGQTIDKGTSIRSWLYVNNRPVICTRHMEVAALVSAINPSLNSTSDAVEVALLKQELLWLLYDLGCLKKYPMAIGNLGDLEEISPKRPEITCKKLFDEAIESARKYYNNQHVYPYIYQGSFFYRNKMYKEALGSWANASDVIRQYNYSRDDEDIYKEFFEISNELIPFVIKLEGSNIETSTILRNPESFANLLRFYDGICQWEEGSATPVLHIGWAKPLVNTISKFEADIRAQVNIVVEFGDKHNILMFNNNNNYEEENDSCDKADKEKSDSISYSSLEDLTAACSKKILNPDYLLQGDGALFVGGSGVKSSDANDTCDKEENGSQSTSKSPVFETKLREVNSLVLLRSHKMKGLKDLLLAEKLNTQAILLHLTAQSQVQIGKVHRNDIDSTRPKRVKRE
ncbi:menin [Cylas formicarius]|uniref:menin n=1 Tax=Cylas formicarius TaxID=197179 RepID=UPI002958ABEB|nr:menin [Cylas formicarius]